MQWLLLGVVVVALLFMSSRYPKAAFSALGVLVVAAAVIVFSTKESAFLSRQKLPIDDVVIENAVIVPAYAGGYRFSARLVNRNDSLLLKESVISITMLDCRDDSDTDCSVIGQTDNRINIKIPAGQARDVSKTISFSAARPAGIVRWQYVVTETRN